MPPKVACQLHVRIGEEQSSLPFPLCTQLARVGMWCLLRVATVVRSGNLFFKGWESTNSIHERFNFGLYNFFTELWKHWNVEVWNVVRDFKKWCIYECYHRCPKRLLFRNCLINSLSYYQNTHIIKNMHDNESWETLKLFEKFFIKMCDKEILYAQLHRYLTSDFMML